MRFHPPALPACRHGWAHLQLADLAAAAAARFYPADNRTMAREMQGIRIVVTSEVPIEGLDPEIEV